MSCLCKFGCIFLGQLLVSLGPVVQAQVATAPLVPDQRVVNPAVIANRILRGYSLSVRRDSEKSQTPANDSSTLGIDLTVDTVALNFGFDFSPFFFEVNLLPQIGNQATKSTFIDAGGLESSSESKRKIQLVPAQGLLAARLGNAGSLGVKALYTSANFRTDDQFGFSDTNGTNKSLMAGTRATDFLAASAGGLLNLFGTGFYLGYSSEFIRLIDAENSQQTFTRVTNTSTDENTAFQNQKTTTTLRKDIMGAGYLTKFSGGNIWRVDISQESMPPLDGRGKDGKLMRLVTEVTWSYFHAGVQMTSTSGYYIDPYNLIPYYFGSQNLEAESVVDYEFFGGLKSSKGHSFGISFSQSTQTKSKDIGNSQTIDLETSEMSYGISYMYAF